MGDCSKKGPLRIKTADLAYLNGADLTIANNGTNNFIILTMPLGKGSVDKLFDDVENRTTSNIKKLNHDVGNKTNPILIIKKI